MDLDLKQFETFLINRGIAPTTAKTYLSGARSFLKHIGPDVAHIEVKQVEAFLTYLFQLGKSSAAIKSTLYQIRAFCRYLQQEGFEVDSSIERLEPIQAWQSSKDVPTPAQLERILNAPSDQTFEGLRDRCIMALLYDCGLRMTEALELHLDDIDLKRKVLNIRRRKTGRTLAIPLIPTAIEALKAFLPRRLFAGNYLFQDNRGHHLSTHHLYPHLMRHIRAGGAALEQMTPHLFRHACAAHLLHSGAEMAAVQTLLGHLRDTSRSQENEIRYLRRALTNHHPRCARELQRSQWHHQLVTGAGRRGRGRKGRAGALKAPGQKIADFNAHYGDSKEG